METVPTTLVRISRYYMVTAVGYLLLTLAIGVLRVVSGVPDDRVHWVPAILGWVSFPIMGAYHQFFPTLQGRDLQLERFTLPQFALVNIGVLGMLVAAWSRADSAFAVAFSIYALGALLFAGVMLGNASPAPQRAAQPSGPDFRRFVRSLVLNPILSLRFYLASLGYFVVAIILLALSVWHVAPSWVSQPLVLHLMVVGWTVLAIMGAEYSMVPMLQLKELRHTRLASSQFYVANLGVIGLAFGIASQQIALTVGGGLLFLASIAVFAYVIGTTLLTGPSRLKKLDISVRFFVVGIGYLIVTALLGTLIAAFGLYNLAPIHLHLGLIGLVTNTIVGAMYHVVPFVVWWEVYAPRLGTQKVPLLKELFDERSASVQLYGLNVGLLLMIGGFALSARSLIAVGGALLIVVAGSFGYQMLRIIDHRKQLKHLA